MGDAIPDDKKSYAFRRLIAKACRVPEYQIDKELLNSIIRLLLSGEDEEEGTSGPQTNSGSVKGLPSSKEATIQSEAN